MSAIQLLERVLAGGGGMGDLMRRHDWSSSLVGPVGEWPQSLRTSVGILLASGYPMLIVWGPDRVQFYNDAFRPILGSTKHPAALGQSAQECWAEIWDSIGPMFERVFQGEEIGARDAPFVLDRNGYAEETYFDFSYSPIRDERGGISGVFVTCMETTKRVLGERRMATLRELAARTAQPERPEDACRLAAEVLGENAADVPFALLYLSDADQGELRLIGTAGFAGSDAPSAVRARRGEAGPWRLFEALDRGEPVLVGTVQAELPSPWPESPPAALALPIVGAELGAPAGVLVAGVSARRALDDDYQGFLSLAAAQVASAVARARSFQEAQERAAALAELDRAKTAFFSNVSHEFRTPLTLLLGPLDDLLAGDSLRGPDRRRLELARRNALRLLALVNTLLDFARLEAGRADASFQAVDLSGLTRDLVSAFASAVERSGLSLVVECEPLPEHVYVDSELWEKIVFNLVSNAIKFTFEGEIAISMTSRDEAAVLVVRDTGVGISAEELPRLFERFHRVRGARGRTHEGAGIGLALVDELVRLHGGTIEVASEPGRGTTFTVSVPFGTAHLPPTRVETAVGAPATTVDQTLVTHATPALVEGDAVGEPDAADGDPAARILLVDDNADMREYLRSLLIQHWPVETVADGRAALEVIRERPPDLVIADVMMPALDGFALVAALRGDARTSAIPIVLLSARAGEEATVEGLDAGADDYLVKPFSARELIARVRITLELARLRNEAGRLQALEEIRARVITTVSHELRTPVSAIYGASKTLEQVGLIDDATQRDLLAVINSESERLARITSDILTVETLASGTLSVATQSFDGRPLVNDALAAALATAPASVRLRADVPAEPVLVRADRARLQQVLANVVDERARREARSLGIEGLLACGSVLSPGDRLPVSR